MYADERSSVRKAPRVLRRDHRPHPFRSPFTRPRRDRREWSHLVFGYKLRPGHAIIFHNWRVQLSIPRFLQNANVVLDPDP